MRYAVLSDIHGNLEALAAVLEFLAEHAIDRYLCLGDVVGYGADPSACLERLQACRSIIVSGNHDAACVGRLAFEWFNDAARAAIVWTREQLSIAELDTLRGWPLTAAVEPMTLVHASLRRPEQFDYLVDVAQVVDTLDACRTFLCLAGHTHVPTIMEYDRTQRSMRWVLTDAKELRDVELSENAVGRCYLVNPGSIGQPRDGDARASVAIIDMGRRRVGVHRVPYDVVGAQRKIRAAGLPEILAHRLAIGR